MEGIHYAAAIGAVDALIESAKSLRLSLEMMREEEKVLPAELVRDRRLLAEWHLSLNDSLKSILKYRQVPKRIDKLFLENERLIERIYPTHRYVRGLSKELPDIDPLPKNTMEEREKNFR